MKQESRRIQRRERQLPSAMRQGNHPCLFSIMVYDVILPAPNLVSPAKSLSLLLSILAAVTFLWIPLLIYLIVKYGIKAHVEPPRQPEPNLRMTSGPTQPQNTKGKVLRFPQISHSKKI